MAAEEGPEDWHTEDAAARIVNTLKPWDPTWKVAVELAVHIQARAFGFQIVNASQEETQRGLSIPACSGLAADHLLQLLQDRLAVIVSEGAEPLHPTTFFKSIQSLHAAYFASGPYIEWKRKSNVAVLDRHFQQLTYSHSIRKQAGQRQHGGGSNGSATFVGVSSSPEWVRQLAELSLFFLLWTEAANLRHTPELLWLLYHIMLSSNNQAKALSLLEAPDCHYSLVHWLSLSQPQQPNSSAQTDPEYGDALAHGFVHGVLLPARNSHGNAMHLGTLLLEGPNPYGLGHNNTQVGSSRSVAGYWWSKFSQTSLAERQCDGLKELKARGVVSSNGAAWSLSELVEADLAFFGDGCIVLDMVIQPIFNLMAEQIGLMGAAREQPALRLGYDDFNESACIDSVLSSLSRRLKHEVSSGADPWDRLLLFYDKHAAATSKILQQSGSSDSGYRPVTHDMQQRYPRDFRRLGKLAGMLKAIMQPHAAAADGNTAAAAAGTGSVHGSAPVGHLLASLRVTDNLWAKLFKKSFIETRSLGAVAVAFSRLLIMHAVLLCWMSLWAYMIPDWTPSSMFTTAFWSQHGMEVAEYASWGLFVHAVLHVIKDLVIFHLLSSPKALRVQEIDGDQNPVLQDAKDTADAGFVQRKKQQMNLWWKKQWCSGQLKEGDMVLVQPPVHPGKILKGHNVITLLFWVVCAFVLLDSHIASWPLNRVLSKTTLFSTGTAHGVVMPVWAMAASVYAGLWLLHQLWKLVTDILPDNVASKLGPLVRKDDRRAAEHFFPYGNMHNSQDFKRYIVNCLLWVLVFTGKFFFDFFVILKPLAQGPGVKLLHRLDASVPWTEWVESILLVWSFWVASAFLVFYDTGLFWQLVGALYSTLVLGMNRRVGHVKTWHDLTWAFPRLSHKLAQRMLPATAIASPSRPFNDEPNAEVIEAAAAAAIQQAEPLDRHSGSAAGSDNSTAGDGGGSLPFPLHKLPCCPPSEVLFAQAWDKVVDDLRSRDLLSNAEAGRLKYELVSIAPDPKVGAWMLLPRFVAAGAAVEAAHLGVSSASQIDAVCRSFNLLVWLLHTLNLITDAQLSDMLLAKSAPAKGSPGLHPQKASHGDVEKAAAVLKDSKELLEKLKAKLQDRSNPVSVADVDTQLLLEATMKGLRGLKGPKAVDVTAAIAPKGWQQQRQLPLRVIGWLLDMLSLTRGQAAPVIPEAIRVLCFFATSLNNPKMPTAANVACSRSMTTLTPHYGEDVMYALSQATAAAEMKMASPRGDEEGSSFLISSRGDPTETLNYLRVSYKVEWRNFVERLLTRAEVAAHCKATSQAVPAEADVTHADFLPGAVMHPWLHEALIWASMRGQLLQRTVHGMMYYETALQQLILMQAKAALAEEAYRVAAEVGIPLRRRNDWVAAVVDKAALLLARQKYTYVVSSQALGELQSDGKVSKRWLAHCIRTVIARNYPNLRIAYLDWENLGAPPKAQTAAAAARHRGRAVGAADVAARNRTKGAGAHQLLRQYSVLLKWSQQSECVHEQYRVRLPINLETDTGVILGEGKPENQNHAVIFCHSETLQTIDSNQDSYLVEALKLPNLLAEFDGHHGKAACLRGSIASSQGSKRLAGAPQQQGPALVGFREWVFSEDSGALAEFAAATERSFGTTVQRVMHNPGGCRFHYGHPDVWCKLFTMTNGGVSKATKELHVSEDVFGGYNVMLRGRDITYVDYIAVGKGRDMGFETINTFEAKIAGGNGEQVVSRDVHRLARRLNTARLLTWYHTGNGFFINTSLLMYSLLVNAWLCLLLALSGSSSVGGLILQDSLALLGGLQLMQLGSLSILVYVATVWLEDGLLTTLKNLLKQLVSGSLLFYVFRGQTSAHAFRSDVQYGGAKYVATGRGYKLKATPFMDLFQAYARSHMWFGGHLLLLMVTSLCVGLPVSLYSLWSYALVILALLVAPFWFNPFAFDWDENKLAGREFLAWMAGHKPAGTTPQLWREFNHAQLRQAADDAGVQLGRSFGSVCGLFYLLPSAVVIGYAVFYMLDYWWKSVILMLAVNSLIGVLLACWSQATRLEAVKGAAVLSRAVKFILKFLVFAGLVTLFAFLIRPQQRWLGRALVRILYVEFELARLTSRVLLAFLPHYQPARHLVNLMCWLGDFALGLLLLLLLFIGSLFGLLTRYQASVLFSMGYAASYLAEKRLEDSEVGRLAKELQELQKRERLANHYSSQQQLHRQTATGGAVLSSSTTRDANHTPPAGSGVGRSASAPTAPAATTSTTETLEAGAQPTVRADSLPVQPEALIQQIAEYCQTLQEEASCSSSTGLAADMEHTTAPRSTGTSPIMPTAAGNQPGPAHVATAGGCSVTRGAKMTAAATATTISSQVRRSSSPDEARTSIDWCRNATGSMEPVAKGWDTPTARAGGDSSNTGSTSHQEAWGRVSAAFLQASSSGGVKSSTGGTAADDGTPAAARTYAAGSGSTAGLDECEPQDEWVGEEADLSDAAAGGGEFEGPTAAEKQPPAVTRVESAVGRTWD